MTKSFAVIAGLAAMLTASASAQNLLPTNPDFDSGDTTYEGNTGVFTEVAGWVFTLSGEGQYGGVASDQNGIGTPNFAYVGGDGRWETAPASRAPVTAGETYLTSYDIRTDSGNTNGAFVLIDWYSNATDFTGLISSTNFGNDIVGQPSSGGSPFMSFTDTVVAPAGASFAAFRWTTTDANGPDANGQVIADNFGIAVPEPGTLCMGLIAGLGLLGGTRRRKT